MKTKKGTGFSIRWASQQTSYGIMFIVLGYLTYYCTNVLHLSAGLVGVVLLISKLFDGVTDLIAAVIIEGTNTKAGKARPYSLLLPVAWLLTVGMFSTPAFGTFGKAMYIFIMYFLINSVCLTMVGASENVYLARSLEDTADSAKVLSVAGLFTGIFSMAASIIFPLMITSIGSQEGGWGKMMAIFAVPGILLTFIRFFTIKERTDIPKGNDGVKFTFRDMVRVLMNNRHVFLLVTIQMCANVFSNLGTAVTTYYFQYIVGDINKQSLFSAMQIIGLLFLVFVPSLLKKMPVKKIMMIGFAAGIIGCAMRFVPVYFVLLISSILTAIASTPTSMLLPSLLIECMDYNEWKTGERVEAVFSSANTLATKLGSGVASILAGVIMGIAGYDGSLAVQTASGNASIVILFALIPMLMFVLMFFTIRRYHIDEVIPGIREELEEKRAGGSEYEG